MYAYVWNPETGGFRLTTEKLIVSKEPRPVYARELDILGFDKHFKYDPQMDVPYMWAEANNYWYRGRQIAKTVGGALYTPPKLEILDADGIETLLPVDIDAMVAENAEIFKALVQATIKKIYDTYKRYRNKVDIFHVSYSGGKDSEVTLDLVQRAIPHHDFVVIFGDTGMEFPDTYKAVSHAQEKCKEMGIQFYIAKSHIKPEKSWRIFGPPSTTIRWCCSVHKTAPQLLKLREILASTDVKEMSFVGIRGDESQKRSEYTYTSSGMKHKGQYSCNPILDWSSAEVYLYLFSYKLYINNAYKIGNSRAGCLVCPMSGEKPDFMRRTSYPEEVDRLIDIIKEVNTTKLETEADMFRYYNIGGWKVRKNGRDLNCLPERYVEKEANKTILLNVIHPNAEWNQWIKTIGDLIDLPNGYQINTSTGNIQFDILYNQDGYKVIINNDVTEASAIKLLKQVFRKSAYCISCRECEADCPNGFINMKTGRLTIDDRCIRCGNCHKPVLGCLVYQSLVLPKGTVMGKNSSLDCYQDHAPKPEWFEELFSNPSDFFESNSLGKNQIDNFKRFLKHAEILPDKTKTLVLTPVGEIVIALGQANAMSWGIMLVNLSYTPEVNWYIKNIKSYISYSRSSLNETIVASYPKVRANSVTGAYKRILSLPFGTKLGLGKVTEEGKETYFRRGTWTDPEPLVILYALYKFAVACGDYYEFTLTRLLDHEIDSDGVSPTEIFNLDRETMVPILKGLAINYPEFISVTFTHDLDAISLNREKAPIDVLRLIADGETYRG